MALLARIGEIKELTVRIVLALFHAFVDGKDVRRVIPIDQDSIRRKRPDFIALCVERVAIGIQQQLRRDRGFVWVWLS